jgi:hypothetical protein
MTITYHGVEKESRNASKLRGVRTYSETYKLEATASETAYQVGSDSNLPSIADVHADDDQAYCISIIPRCVAGNWWEVEAQWSTERRLDADPEQDEVRVSWTSEIYQEAVYRDVDGNGILNSAGDYFIDPLTTRDNSHIIAKISSNHSSIPAWVLSKQNNVNSSQITIGGLVIAAGLARMSRLEISERQRRNAIDFYTMSFEVHLHEDGWRARPLDAGFRRLEYGEPVQIKDQNGDEVTTPVLLDGNGEVLDPVTPETAVYGNYQIYVESDLTSLPGIS